MISTIEKILSITILLVFTSFYVSCTRHKETNVQEITIGLNERYRSLVQTHFLQKAIAYNADTRYLIFVDYSIPSNNDRLFIWDNEKEKIVEKFWCAHGFGGNSTADRPEFSNVPGSNCSSLGWFLVDRSVGVSATYGYRYHAVDGLDPGNSNARKRQILIHPWSSVTTDCLNKIKHPMDLDYRSAGCFTTTDEGFSTIDRYVKSCQKKVLLYAIDSINL